MTIICPCTEKHIQKYTSQAIRIVYETFDLYKTVTKPRLQLDSEQFTLDVSRNWPNLLDETNENRVEDNENVNILEIQSREQLTSPEFKATQNSRFCSKF